jgi:hypothetical protein
MAVIGCTTIERRTGHLAQARRPNQRRGMPPDASATAWRLG